MRAPAFLLLITLGNPFIFSSAQTSSPTPLKFASSTLNLGANKNNELILVTRAGEVAFADSINGIWRMCGVQKKNGELVGSMLLDNACYFNTDTAFVSGYLSNRKGEHNIIYHTVNGGKNWKAVEIGLNGWVDDATFLDNGQAWLSVAGGGIAYTKDYGFNWTSFSVPKPKERYSAIYFNKRGEGVIGSLWNDLAYTADNCKSWITIPTPLSQKKYSRVGLHVLPSIKRVAIYKDYLLVKQESGVYYTMRNAINWILLPEVHDFYTDPVNSALFFESSREYLIRCDTNLNRLCEFHGIDQTEGAIVRNGSLFVLEENKLSRIDTNNKIVSCPVYTDSSSSIEPSIIGYTIKGRLGAVGKNVYLEKDCNNKWDYVFNLPFATDSGSLSLKDSNTVLYSRLDDSLIYYNISDASFEKRDKKKMVESFCKKGIQKMSFSQSYMGCFSGGWQEMSFEQKDGRFILTADDAGESTQDTVCIRDSLFGKNGKAIDPKVVKEFVKMLPALYQKNVSIDELGFTRNDYELCRQSILAYKNKLEKGTGNANKIPAFYISVTNPDFDRLLTLVNTVRKLDQKQINQYLIKFPGYTTESYGVKVKLVNTDNEELELSNSDYCHNNFYFPWEIKLNGSKSICNAIEITRFIEEIFPRFLKSTDKVKLLQRLVSVLYQVPEQQE